ncbi:DNA-binding Lrp family transcriptional regulator [Actinoplanes lutulentus]|uniref:AsnC family transcriptional regulator n=1 Tax=Actinoplanes lutulentus TaxID=1287878 RepID=A0A327YY27_9ACTN|nr:Lrp/AsnC family transcriptional regulator [Actinoplanes lutulentus]MBB2946569.1 DNA-binding Lrp family transcriptional regulator [Actinoplanes lutulentus]RAK26487.1 AsnC family transcriptional regulator [Actinoplanes lutulentus]
MTTDEVKEAVAAALASDGRMSVEALSRSLGLTSAVVRKAMTALSDDGLAVRAVVHPAVLGLPECAHLRLRVDGPLDHVLDALCARPEIPFVSHVAGGHTLSAEIRVAARTTLASVVAEVAALPGVAGVDLDEYLDIVRDASLDLPRPGVPQPLDEIDRALVTELQADGRRSFAAMGEQVGLTTASTRSRVLRLIETEALRIGVRRRPGPGTVQVGYRLSAPATRAETLTVLRDLPDMSYLALTTGSADFVGTLTCASLGDASRALTRLRAVPGVRALQSWTHLDVVKEIYA